MRKFALLFLLCCGVLSTAASGELIKTGPFTIDSNAPIGEFYGSPSDPGKSYTIGGYMRGVSGSASGGVPLFEIGSTSFAFDLDPGWSIHPFQISDNIDFGMSPGHDGMGYYYDGHDWRPAENDGVVAFFQVVILCPSSSKVNCTEASVIKQHYGLPELIPDSILNPSGFQAGPSTGLYAYGLYANYAGFSSYGHGPASISFRVDPVPEPSTFLMLGSGALGAIGAAYRRRRIV